MVMGTVMAEDLVVLMSIVSYGWAYGYSDGYGFTSLITKEGNR